jgi:membrane-bound lytic murein transglycosylase D
MTRDFDYITLVSMCLKLRQTLFMAFILILTSCSSFKKKHHHDAPLLPGMSAEIPASNSVPEDEAPLEEDIPDLDAERSVSDEMEEVDSEVHPETTPKKRQIPFEFNKRVAKWVSYFSQKDRERFQRFFDRGEPYREVIEDILEENGVPTDLYYLGMIESGFNARAKSTAKAVGVWQFMRTTGKLYGLRSDSYVDERRDPIRATEAAARMLRDLNRQFKSWYLAMAAYNAGSGRIRSAIRRGRSHDFWTLAERRVLPAETMDYVPKFLAARYIGENPGLFGFFINEERKYPDVEQVKVPPSVSFSEVESACGIPDGILDFVNPHYLSPRTHPAKSVDQIWVPTKYAKSVELKFNDLLGLRKGLSKRPTNREGGGDGPAVVVVRRGDTLKSIASRRGLSVAYLKRMNGLESSLLLPGQKLRVSARSYHRLKAHPRKGRKKRARG